jgi:nicotinate phosphoribosyltransferase
VVEELAGFAPHFVGTSNVWLAREFKVKPIGTMAHEWFMGLSVLEGLRHANRHALHAWLKVYQGSLGIALTDTYGTDVFFKDFDALLSRQFDGVRQDSGDPLEFVEKALAHYQRLRIPADSKTIIFSDALDVDRAIEIRRTCGDRMHTSFGIGTHLTNDFAGAKALNMVIKLWSVNGMPVVKLSDAPGKEQGERDAVRVARWTFDRTPLDAQAE